MQAKVCKEPELEHPHMVTGLPGVGFVAKLSADYLIKQLEAELFEELYCPSFPPYVLIGKDGIVELLKNEFFYWKNDKSKNDLIIFTGNAQASTQEGQYEVAEEVLNVAMKYKVEKLFAMAAYMTGQPVKEPKVYGAATEPKLIEELKEYGVLTMDTGSISGTNGLIFGLAKLKNIQSLCLLSETPGYETPSGRIPADAKAAKALLEALKKMLNIKIDMAPLEEQAKITEEFIQKIDEMKRHLDETTRKPTAPPQDIYL